MILETYLIESKEQSEDLIIFNIITYYIRGCKTVPATSRTPHITCFCFEARLFQAEPSGFNSHGLTSFLCYSRIESNQNCIFVAGAQALSLHGDKQPYRYRHSSKRENANGVDLSGVLITRDGVANDVPQKAGWHVPKSVN